MNLNDYHNFAIVSRLGSITEAAKFMSVPKSTVSRRLKRLEESLGVELFNRSPKKIALNHDGQAFYDRIRPMIDELLAAQSALGQSQAHPSGRLKISTTEGYGQTPSVLNALRTYLDKYPQVSIDLQLTSRVVDMVEERVDIGLRLYTGDLPGDANTMARGLHRIANGIFASPAYIESHNTIESIADLQAHHYVAFPRVYFSRKPWLFNGKPHEGTLPFSEPRLLVNNTAALLQCAVSGLGLSILDLGSAQVYERRGQLVRILPELEQQIARVSLVWMASKHLSVNVRSFINHMTDCLGEG